MTRSAKTLCEHVEHGQVRLNANKTTVFRQLVDVGPTLAMRVFVGGGQSNATPKKDSPP